MTEPEDPDLDAFANALQAQWQAADGLAAPRRIGRYRLERELGRGGQGAVFLAEDEHLHRRVALKLLTALHLSSPDVLARFRREAQLASKLDHPGLCTVFDSGVHRGTPFIAMRYVQGETLERRIALAREAGQTCVSIEAEPSATAGDRSSRDRVSRVLELIEKVARAMHVAHGAGVVHRDLKPSNVVITAEGQPVVLDFGIAGDLEGEFDTLTRTGDVFGTPAYMAVEQVRGTPGAVDARSDVWALGVMLYECVTLTRPFTGATREALFSAIKDTDPPDPRTRAPGLPEDLGVVLATALEKDPRRRYATALDFAEDLRAVRVLEPIRARPAGPWIRTRRWAQRNRALAAVVVTVFTLLVAGLAWTVHLLGITARERDEKTTALEEVARLAGLKHVRDLAAWDDRLWPPWPELVPGPGGMDAWLRRARALHDRLPEHEQSRRDLQSRTAAHEATGSAGILTDDLAAFRDEALRELIDALRALPTRIDAVEARRRQALAVEGTTLVDAAAAWETARAAVAAEPRYRGVALAPMRGLVPLGSDPRSGLQEFAHVQSGRPPARLASGSLELAEDTAIVLVLVPGGTFVMGASRDPEHPRYDPFASEDEGPPHPVTLAPFLIAKHETTQAQWMRVMGANPSGLPMGKTERGTTYTGLHPVEQVSWRDAMEAARRMDLALPTEAQWEYACRAGTQTWFSTGDDVATLRGHANVLDAGSGKIAPGGREPEPGFDDGFVYHAPVGRFAANGFGLHDMHGNVWEMCGDYYAKDYRTPVRPGDGLRLVPDGQRAEIAVRSSSFDFGARLARCALRNNSMPDYRYYSQGLRLARGLDR